MGYRTTESGIGAKRRYDTDPVPWTRYFPRWPVHALCPELPNFKWPPQQISGLATSSLSKRVHVDQCINVTSKEDNPMRYQLRLKLVVRQEVGMVLKGRIDPTGDLDSRKKLS